MTGGSLPAAVPRTRFTEADVQRVLASRTLHLNHYGHSRLPFAFAGGHGIEIDAVDLREGRTGRELRLLDASGGYASAPLGVGHDVVRGALSRGADAGFATDEVGSLERATLLDRLFGPAGLWRAHFPPGDYHVSGRNSGSEGLELAMRMVLESRFDARRLRPRRDRERRDAILAFTGAWHGWTDGLVPLLNRRHYRVGLPAPDPRQPYGIEVRHIDFGDAGALEEHFAGRGDRLLAVVVEPVQGDAGILAPPPGYLGRLAQLCAAHGVLLVADEVLTFARTGRFFAMEDDGPVPTDITVIGKYLGMGAISTSMVIARRELGVRGSGAVATSDLRPLTCAVIGDGLDHLVRHALVEGARDLGARLRERLAGELVERFPQIYHEVRGVGAMNGVELTGPAAARLGALREHLIGAGVYVEFMAGAGRRAGRRYVHPTLRLAPALVTTPEQIDEIVDRLRTGTQSFLADT